VARERTANVTVTAPGTINLPSGATVGLGKSTSFAINLAAPATSAVSVALASTDINKLTISTASVNIAAGQTASYMLSIGGEGMSGTASLTCTGAPTSATCSLPASQAFNATTPTTFTIKVATTARIVAALQRPAFAPASSTSASWLWTIALGMLFVPGTRVPKWSARRWRRYLWLAPLMLLFFSVSCGGGGSMGNQQPQQNGTPSGTYSVVVHANSGSKKGSVSLTLIVQ